MIQGKHKKEIVRNSKNYLKGSYTIEAAAVISLVFLILGTFLICGFYIHDKGVLQGIVCEMAAAGSNFSTEKERKQAVSEVKQYISKNRFLGSKNIKGSASIGKKETEASWQSIFPVPGFAMKYLIGNRLKIEKEWKSKVLDPSKTLWRIRGAEKLFQIEEG